MGAVNSCCIPNKEMGSSTNTPKEKGHRRNLSATFNMSVIENSSIESSLVNVNTASEEELMTLPGVNRVIAKSIVDYRNHIGGFRKVEDLALTPGVGAAKLANMRYEIYVDSPDLDESVKGKQNPSPQRETNSEPASVISINSANIFNLLRVKGIGMTIAKNIVAYREKHGKYKKLDELLKVKGIEVFNLDALRPFLTVEDKHQTLPKLDNAKNGSCVNDKVVFKTTDQEQLDQEYILRSTSSLENLLQILGPLAKVPERPKVDKVLLKYNECQVFRMASWNLDTFSLEKASNPGVKDVVCMTILENGFGLVAVQELADKHALSEICRELNSPTLPNVRKWTGKRGQWSCVVSEAASFTHGAKKHHGFIYDKSQNIEFITSRLLKTDLGEDKGFACMSFLGKFKVKQGLNFAVVNVHLKATDLENVHSTKAEETRHMIRNIIITAKQEITDQELIVVLGDFNQVANENEVFDELQTDDYVRCIPPEPTTDIHKDNSTGEMSCGNIWVSKKAQDAYTGISGIVRDGLASTWIPNGWSWGGVVSSDCPVYAQMYSSKNLVG